MHGKRLGWAVRNCHGVWRCVGHETFFSETQKWWCPHIRTNFFCCRMSTNTRVMPSRKTHYVHRHCRAIKSGRKAKSPCTRNGKSGTVIKGHYSPKMYAAQHRAAARIQAGLRGRRTRSNTPKRSSMGFKNVYSAGKIASALRKFSARRSAEKTKAAKLAKALKQLA